MTKSKDPMWSHVTKDGSKLKCNYCKKVYSCTITRMKSHLGRIPHMDIELCNVSPESVMQLARSAAQELGRKKGKTKGINEYMRASVDNSQVEKTIPNVPDTATTTATVLIPLGQGVVNIEDDDIDYAENDGDDVDLDYDDIQHDYAAPHFLFD
ncbi:hypothetical protein IFM89_026998 [Coptis chinensis]|uniref:BED-type domain-containing protein n=1 Tax=Coptis chinensis TaxID=261450 RepID=A0A835I1Y4_9MAGN|nr:hypothetical protein IFM89_026998 [Coptis chinensis]